MAQVVKLKRSGVTGKVPDTDSLELGEIAINTFDGRAFIKKSGSGFIENVVHLVTTDSITTGSVYLSGSITASNALIYNNIQIGVSASSGGTLTIWKNSSGEATISFPAATPGQNDTGYIKHIESTQDVGRFEFRVGDNGSPSAYDEFWFGSSVDPDVITFRTSGDIIQRTGSLTLQSGSISVSNNITASIVKANQFTGSLFGTSSWAQNVLTASFVNNLNQNLSITGALILSGSTAPELRVIGDTQFTGSVSSLYGYTGSLLGTASWAIRALTASLATTASFTLSASFATTASYALNGVTISNNVNNYVLTATGTSGSINGESGLIYDSATGILEVNNNIDIGSSNTHIDSGIIVIGSNNIAGSSGGAGNYILIGQANELDSRLKNSLVVGGKVIIGDDTQQSIIAGISHSIGANRNILASGEGLYVYDSDERLIIGKYNVRNTENPKVSSSLFTIGNGKGDGTRNDLLNVFPNNYDDPQTAEVIVTGSIIATRRIQAPSFTGSLFGTASWAVRALTASLATTASFTISASFATTASFVLSASFATTALTATSASFATTALSASFATSASLAIRNYVTASSLADQIRLFRGDGTSDSIEVIIGGTDHSVAYFSGSNNIEDAQYVKIYDETYDNKSSFRVGNLNPTLPPYSGSHVLKDGHELLTNARTMTRPPAVGGATTFHRYYFLGFPTIDTKVNFSATEDYQTANVDNYITLAGGTPPPAGTLPSNAIIPGALRIGGIYGTVSSNGVYNLVSNQYTTLPGSPGMLMGDGKLSIFRSESMIFDSSGSLLSPHSSASAQFTLASDSSSLSILVGKENLQEVMFLSYSLKEPKIGIGTSQPKSIFDIKSIADNSIGTELLIRSARTELKGGNTGDAAGKIIFSIDSSSYSNLKTSGSVAIITSEVTSISSEGAAGDLILKASDTDKNEPSEVLRINNDTSIFSSSLNVKGQLLTLSSSQFAVISTTIGSDANTNVDTFSTSVYKGGFYDYTLMSSAGARIGQFMVLSGSSNLTFTDTSAPAIGGDPVEPSLSASFSGANLISVRITNGNGYTFKAIRRLL
jgi:hypothetical protein